MTKRLLSILCAVMLAGPAWGQHIGGSEIKTDAITVPKLSFSTSKTCTAAQRLTSDGTDLSCSTIADSGQALNIGNVCWIDNTGSGNDTDTCSPVGEPCDNVTRCLGNAGNLTQNTALLIRLPPGRTTERHHCIVTPLEDQNGASPSFCEVDADCSTSHPFLTDRCVAGYRGGRACEAGTAQAGRPCRSQCTTATAIPCEIDEDCPVGDSCSTTEYTGETVCGGNECHSRSHVVIAGSGSETLSVSAVSGASTTEGHRTTELAIDMTGTKDWRCDRMIWESASTGGQLGIFGSKGRFTNFQGSRCSITSTNVGDNIDTDNPVHLQGYGNTTISFLDSQIFHPGAANDASFFYAEEMAGNFSVFTAGQQAQLAGNFGRNAGFCDSTDADHAPDSDGNICHFDSTCVSQYGAGAKCIRFRAQSTDHGTFGIAVETLGMGPVHVAMGGYCEQDTHTTCVKDADCSAGSCLLDKGIALPNIIHQASRQWQIGNDTAEGTSDWEHWERAGLTGATEGLQDHFQLYAGCIGGNTNVLTDQTDCVIGAELIDVDLEDFGGGFGTPEDSIVVQNGASVTYTRSSFTAANVQVDANSTLTMANPRVFIVEGDSVTTPLVVGNLNADTAGEGAGVEFQVDNGSNVLEASGRVYSEYNGTSNSNPILKLAVKTNDDTFTTGFQVDSATGGDQVYPKFPDITNLLPNVSLTADCNEASEVGRQIIVSNAASGEGYAGLWTCKQDIVSGIHWDHVSGQHHRLDGASIQNVVSLQNANATTPGASVTFELGADVENVGVVDVQETDDANDTGTMRLGVQSNGSTEYVQIVGNTTTSNNGLRVGIGIDPTAALHVAATDAGTTAASVRVQTSALNFAQVELFTSITDRARMIFDTGSDLFTLGNDTAGGDMLIRVPTTGIITTQTDDLIVENVSGTDWFQVSGAAGAGGQGYARFPDVVAVDPSASLIAACNEASEVGRIVVVSGVAVGETFNGLWVCSQSINRGIHWEQADDSTSD